MLWVCAGAAVCRKPLFSPYSTMYTFVNIETLGQCRTRSSKEGTKSRPSFFLTLGTSSSRKLHLRERNPFPCLLKERNIFYVNIPLCFIIDIFSWMTRRWNNAGTWKCTHKTTSCKVEYTSSRDTWKGRKTKKGCSCQHVQKFKIWALSLVNISDRWFRSEEHTWGRDDVGVAF